MNVKATEALRGVWNLCDYAVGGLISQKRFLGEPAIGGVHTVSRPEAFSSCSPDYWTLLN